MKRAVFLFCLAALLPGLASAAAPRIAGAQYVRYNGWPVELPFQPSGENQLTMVDGSEVCCSLSIDHLADPTHTSGGCAVQNNGGLGYNGGDAVTLNTYWLETVVVAQNWLVEWTLGVRIPNGQVVFLFRDEPVDFGFVEPGTYKFCIAGILTLPPQCSGGAVVTQGHGVTTPGGTLPVNQSDPPHTNDTFTCN